MAMTTQTEKTVEMERRIEMEKTATPQQPSYLQRSVAEVCTKVFWRDLFAEFIGTFFLVATQCCLLVYWYARSQGGAIVNGLGMGFLVCVLVTTFGDFGGGHFNPAVTVPMMLLGRTLLIKGILYIIVQSGAGILGAGFSYLMTPADRRETLGVTQPGEGVKFWQVLCIEMWMTCSLVLVILASTNTRRKLPTHAAPIPIGLAVGVGLLLGYGYTGGSMNPARSLGPAVIYNVWEYHWVYWVAPISGGILALIIYTLLDSVDRPKADLDLHVVCSNCTHQVSGAHNNNVIHNSNNIHNNNDMVKSVDENGEVHVIAL